MLEQQGKRHANLLNDSINLRSLVNTLAVVLLIGSSGLLLNSCSSSNQSESLSPDMSDRELLEESRKARSEAMKTLERVQSETE